MVLQWDTRHTEQSYLGTLFVSPGPQQGSVLPLQASNKEDIFSSALSVYYSSSSSSSSYFWWIYTHYLLESPLIFLLLLLLPLLRGLGTCWTQWYLWFMGLISASYMFRIVEKTCLSIYNLRATNEHTPFPVAQLLHVCLFVWSVCVSKHPPCSSMSILQYAFLLHFSEAWHLLLLVDRGLSYDFLLLSSLCSPVDKYTNKHTP